MGVNHRALLFFGLCSVVPSHLATITEKPSPSSSPQTSNVPARVVLLGQRDSDRACKATHSDHPTFVPPAPFPPTPGRGQFWFGTNLLWTMLPENGTWNRLPKTQSGYTQKMAWFSEGYDWKLHPHPALAVVGKTLAKPISAVTVAGITGVNTNNFGSAMAVQLTVPTLGCWEIAGRYKEQEVRFVVFVSE